MQYLIVADIFGRTTALEEMASRISEASIIFDPYAAELMHFPDESAAYAYFSEQIGLAGYTAKLSAFITGLTAPITLIGFSVGAAAIWNISNQDTLPKISQALCFYGSQIRNALNVNPRFPLQLIFPAREDHFSVSAVIEKLQIKDNVNIEQVEFLHGFMNLASENYAQSGYDHYLQQLANLPAPPVSEAIEQQ